MRLIRIPIFAAFLLGSNLAFAGTIPNNLLGSGTAYLDGQTSPSLTAVSLSTPVNLVAGQEYWIAVYEPANQGNWNLWVGQNGGQTQDFSTIDTNDWTWGENPYGATGNPPAVAALFVPINGGSSHTIFSNLPATANEWQLGGGVATSFVATSNATVTMLEAVIGSSDDAGTQDSVILGLFDSASPSSSSTPEPTSFLLVVPGLATIVWQRWQRRRRGRPARA